MTGIEFEFRSPITKTMLLNILLYRLPNKSCTKYKIDAELYGTAENTTGIQGRECSLLGSVEDGYTRDYRVNSC